MRTICPHGSEFVLLLIGSLQAIAQSTAFTYQGKLTDGGNPASGSYDLQFSLFDDPTVGSGIQQGLTQALAAVPVSSGIFTVALDFGIAVFSGANRFLEIGVRPAGSASAHVLLSPRQPITSSPYAIRSLDSQFLGGLSASRYVATDADGNIGIGTPPSREARLVVDRPNGPFVYYGIWGKSAAATAVRGDSTGGGSGVSGSSIDGHGVVGTSDNSTGVYGASGSGAAPGVLGVGSGNGPGTGVNGVATAGTGVLGSTNAVSTTYGGVVGQGLGSGSIGVIGEANSGVATGVYGVTTSPGGFGVYARNNAGTTGWALAAEGPRAALLGGTVQVLGNLSKGGGSFKIDHPLDPENKYLSHSFVESPDMKNIYDGNVTTDARGLAEVALPDWFEALNKEFRYQLTVIGTFAQAIVAEEIVNNRFTIATNAPNVKVSWMVTGIRKDAYANQNRIPIEEAKAPELQGSYLHPASFGKPAEMSELRRIQPEVMRSAPQAGGGR